MASETVRAYPTVDAVAEAAGRLPGDSVVVSLEEFRARRFARQRQLAPAIANTTGEIEAPQPGIGASMHTAIGHAAFGLEHLTQDLTTGANHSDDFVSPYSITVPSALSALVARNAAAHSGDRLPVDIDALLGAQLADIESRAA